MDRLVLAFLGGFQARLESGRDIPVQTRKGQALLAYLACRPNEGHLRGELATLLWGDMQDSRARHNLRQTLYVLRSALPGSVSAALSSASDSISLDAASLDVDVVAFEHLAQDGAPKALEEAAALYKGDLLAGISVDESAFEDWLRAERERLRDLAVDVFAKLLNLRREGGFIERAVQTGHRLLRFDPSEEVVHRTLMRLYASLGRFAAVRRQYQICAEALRRELDIDPSFETTQLFHELVPDDHRRSCRAGAASS